ERLLAVPGDEMRTSERLVHRGQIEVLELGGELAADRFAPMRMEEGGLGPLQLRVDPGALPFGPRHPGTFAETAPVVARRVRGMDHFRVLRVGSMFESEQVPDVVEQRNAEPPMELGIVGLAL